MLRGFMKNRTYITVAKTSFGTHYKVRRDVTSFLPCELQGAVNVMNDELDRKIEVENDKKPRLP